MKAFPKVWKSQVPCPEQTCVANGPLCTSHVPAGGACALMGACCFLLTSQSDPQTTFEALTETNTLYF